MAVSEDQRYVAVGDYVAPIVIEKLRIGRAFTIRRRVRRRSEILRMRLTVSQATRLAG